MTKATQGSETFTVLRTTAIIPFLTTHSSSSSPGVDSISSYSSPLLGIAEGLQSHIHVVVIECTLVTIESAIEYIEALALAAASLRPLPAAPEGEGLGGGGGGGGWGGWGGWGCKSPNASSSNKGWPGQSGVHEPGLARRQGEPELQPEDRLTSTGGWVGVQEPKCKFQQQRLAWAEWGSRAWAGSKAGGARAPARRQADVSRRNYYYFFFPLPRGATWSFRFPIFHPIQWPEIF
ncbi:unnamed protein product [Prunus armeniaca]